VQTTSVLIHRAQRAAALAIENRRLYEQLSQQAHFDALTQLPNRLLFHDRLEHCLARSTRDGGAFALLYLDLDHFKHINDTLGHDVGDGVLRQLSAALSEASRCGDTLARLGGDEFVIILEDGGTPEAISQVAEKIRTVVSRPFTIAGQEIYLTASIGISVFPADGTDAQALLKHADLALYKAKELGRNTLQFYETELGRGALERMALHNALRSAIGGQQFFLHFQPQVSLRDGGLCGVEVLLRWQHPELGLVSPARFIPAAEEIGLIGVLGDWVLEASCRQLSDWREAGFEVPRLAVNLSAQQLRQKEFSARVEQLLARWEIPAAQLELEVTESMLMDTAGQAAENLDALRRQGIYLAVDDFGTGYSSLAYLQRLSVHRLKIDQSFARDIGHNPSGENIVKAVIALGESLGLDLVAEGVEHEAQAAFLRQAGCSVAQGYLFSRPVPAAEILRDWAVRQSSPA